MSLIVNKKVFGAITSDAEVRNPFVFPQGLRGKHGGLHQVPGGVSASLCKEDLCMCDCACNKDDKIIK